MMFAFRFGEKQTIFNPFVLGSSDRRVERLLKNINLHPSVPSDLNRAVFSNGFLSKKGKNVHSCV